WARLADGEMTSSRNAAQSDYLQGQLDGKGPARAAEPTRATRPTRVTRPAGAVVLRARKLAGPHIRAGERRLLQLAGGRIDAGATRAQVLIDGARSRVGGSANLLRLRRLSPLARVFEPAPSDTPTGLPAEIERWAGERLLDTETVVLQSRSGSLGRLARLKNGEAAGLLVSEMTECLSPSGARALVHLASRKLSGGAVVVIVSAHPEAVSRVDPIAADLGGHRPLHPLTWCHLLSRYGFTEVTRCDVGQPSAYAVAGRRPRGRR
ncbi:MAG: hypothetical protein ACRDZ5_03735, partial [Acidimicrobiales bacterium]